MDLSKIVVISNPYIQSYTAELRGANGRYVTALTKAKKLFLRLPRFKKAFVLEFPAKVKKAAARKKLVQKFIGEVLTEIEKKRRGRRDASDKKKGIVRKKKRTKYPIQVSSTPTTEVPGKGDLIITEETDYRNFEEEIEEEETRTIKVKPFKTIDAGEEHNVYRTFNRKDVDPYEAKTMMKNIDEKVILDGFKSADTQTNYYRFDATLEKFLQEAFKIHGPGYYQALIGVNMKIKDGRKVKTQEGIASPRVYIESFDQIKDITEIPALKSLRYTLANYLTRAMSGKISLNSLALEFVSEAEISGPESDS